MNIKFSKLDDMPQNIIDKYKKHIPAELLRLWEEYGIGFLLDGCLKVINPDDYIDFVKTTYFRGNISIPIFITAFGDIIVYTEEGFIEIIFYKNNNFEIITSKFEHFLMFLEDKSFLEEYFEIPLYEEAIKQYGRLDFDECFGFVPFLTLGGKKSVANMDKVKIREYLDILTQITGGVGMDE